MRLVIETIECAGFGAMLKSLKLPYGIECNSVVQTYTNDIDYSDGDFQYSIEIPTAYPFVEKKDIELLQKLIKRGDDHAKAMRMPQVWANITAPRWFFQELTTYEVGCSQRLQQLNNASRMQEFER